MPTPRPGQHCYIDGAPAIHTGHGEFHLIDERGETVMKEGRTYAQVLRGRLEQYVEAAPRFEGGLNSNVRQGADPGDWWVSSTLAAALGGSAVLFHLIAEGTEIEMLEPERPRPPGGQTITGAAEVSGP